MTSSPHSEPIDLTWQDFEGNRMAFTSVEQMASFFDWKSGRLQEQLETQQEVVRRYVVEISRAPGNRDQAAVDAASEALVALVSNPASRQEGE